jgi:hypothetical protein
MALKSEECRALALVVLAPQLTNELLVEGLHAAMALPTKKYRVSALIALLSYLRGEQRSKAAEQCLEDIMALLNRENQRATLMLQPTKVLLIRCLKTASSLTNERERAELLLALVPLLTDTLLAQTFQALMALPNEKYRESALIALLPQLVKKGQSKILTKGLQAVLTLQNEEYRARALVAFLPYLIVEQHSEMLASGFQAVLALQNEEYRAKLVTILAPLLNNSQLVRGLKAALALSSKDYRMLALIALLSELSENLTK